MGNLILVDRATNEKLADKPFLKKKKILLERGYQLPSIFMDSDELTGELIEANTKRISELARSKIWKI